MVAVTPREDVGGGNSVGAAVTVEIAISNPHIYSKKMAAAAATD